MRLSAFVIACSQAAEPTFYDEFDDLSNWIIHVVPDSQNNEYQYYTDRPKNVRVEDGYLKLTPLREKYAHREYTSGKVTSKFHQKYGRFEIRAKQPNGRGLWPAIWMMPQFSVYGGWPASGEIDIFEGRGQTPTKCESTLHYGAVPCCDNHRYTGSGPRDQGTDITDSFHTYRVDWDPKKMTFYFDDKAYWQTSIDKIMQSPFYKEKGQPFDQNFYLILNVAVGGWFLDGPDPTDEWFYPAGEMWVDWVKAWALEDIETGDQYDYVCKANPDKSQNELCGSAQWACYDQSYADMGDVCDDQWTRCCHRNQCTHDEVVEQCSRVFAQYDSQIHDQNSCDFNGNAIKDWGDSAPTTEPNTNTPPSGGANGSCKGNPNASNSQLCGGLNWTCSDQNWADVTRECGRRLTWGCCWDGGTQCAKADLLTDADSVFDAYYQQQSPNEPNSQHCDFGGSGMLVFN